MLSAAQQNKIVVSHAGVDAEEWPWVFWFSGALILIITLPFIAAYALAPGGVQFLGILNNPIDGISYLAKMRQGAEGSWLFELPYTPEPHAGVFVFTFYLALGHLADWLSLPLILVFHAARLFGSVFMMLAIYQFIANWTDDIGQRRVTWAVALFGTGFTWLTLPFGYAGPDLLTLPEAFPLQAAYTNAHFPWAIAVAALVAHLLVTVLIVRTDNYPEFGSRTVGLAVGTLFLVSVAPFVLVPIAAACGVLLIVMWARSGRFPRRELAWCGIPLLFGLPLMAYGLWAFSAANPVFQAWMAQNSTPSPALWEYMVAFGGLLILAAVGVWGTIKKGLTLADIFLLTWIMVTFALLYAPISLQRRFTLGLILPLAVFAGRGLWRVLTMRVPPRWRPAVLTGSFVMLVPTTLLAVLLPVAGLRTPEVQSLYFASSAEQSLYRWVAANGEDAVFLAAPEPTSLLLPLYGGRVIYGHPFETLDAAARRQAVEAFLSGSDCSILTRENIDYVIVGPHEQALAGGGARCPIDGTVVYQTRSEEIVIYALSAD